MGKSNQWLHADKPDKLKGWFRKVFIFPDLFFVKCCGYGSWHGWVQVNSVPYSAAKNWINGTSEHHLQWKKYEKNSLSYRLSLKTTGWTVWNSSDRRVDSLSLGMWDMDMSSCQPFTNLQVFFLFGPGKHWLVLTNHSSDCFSSFDQYGEALMR